VTDITPNKLAIEFAAPFGQLKGTYGDEADFAISLIQGTGRSALFPIVFPTPVTFSEFAGTASIDVTQFSKDEHASIYKRLIESGLASEDEVKRLKTINEKVKAAEANVVVRPSFQDTKDTYAQKFNPEETPAKIRAALSSDEILFVKDLFSKVVDYVSSPANGINPLMGQHLSIVRDFANSVLSNDARPALVSSGPLDKPSAFGLG